VSAGTDDALLARLMDGADGFVAAHTGREFAGGTFTELHPAGAERCSSQLPGGGVASVKVDAARQFGADTVRAADSYVVLADRGVIRSTAGPFLPRRGPDDRPGCAQVVYSTATGAVPAAVAEAFRQLVAHWYRQVKTFAAQDHQMLTERVVGSDSKSWPWGLAPGLKIPPAVLALLAPYRVPPV
jgi:hypothetical protein